MMGATTEVVRLVVMLGVVVGLVWVILIERSARLRAEEQLKRASRIAFPELFLGLMLFASLPVYAETPVTETGASVYLAAERVMSSAGPAQDEAAGVAFGQVGFGRFGLGGWVLVTGTLQSNQLDVTKVRVLELALAPHWYAYQAKGVAIGPTLVLSSQYGYNTSGEPLVKRSAVTWGGGLHLGGKGSWATLLYGEHEVVGPRAFMGIAHLALSDSTALNADLAQAGGVYQVRLRACYGKR